MEYTAYRLEFQGAVHFGRQSLEEGEYTCRADTIFSSLCQEALKMGKETLERLYLYAKEGNLLISDAFPVIGDTFFIPRPVKRVNAGSGAPVLKKAYKKLKYIPAERLEDYLAGRFDAPGAMSLEKELGHLDIKVSAAVRGGEETRPYRVGAYYFKQNSGLYVIMGYGEQEARGLAEELWRGLGFTGIGGKKSAGMGRFQLHPCSLPADLSRRLVSDGKEYMSLSVSLPREEELEEALADAQYQLCKRSGFVASDTYAAKQMRKKDLYVLAAGSCFCARYEGDIYDVSCGCGSHPVYRYAKPMFLEL